MAPTIFFKRTYVLPHNQMHMSFLFDFKFFCPTEALIRPISVPNFKILTFILSVHKKDAHANTIANAKANANADTNANTDNSLQHHLCVFLVFLISK